MYTLVLVYVITSEKLQPFSPIPKFWAIKSIIFLSFWQQIIVVAMQKAGLLDRFESQYVTTPNNNPAFSYQTIDLMQVLHCRQHRRRHPERVHLHRDALLRRRSHLRFLLQAIHHNPLHLLHHRVLRHKVLRALLRRRLLFSVRAKPRGPVAGLRGLR
jgi:hypothetical protein